MEVGGHNPFSGATVANMNPALAEETGLEHADSGVTVIKIQQGSIAHRLMFRPGDVILKINGVAVAMVADLRAALNSGANRWTITIRRAGETITVTLGG